MPRKNKNKRTYRGGGSIMTPKTREEYRIGGGVKEGLTKILEKLFIRNSYNLTKQVDDIAKDVGSGVKLVFEEAEELKRRGLSGSKLHKQTLINLYGSVENAPMSSKEVEAIIKAAAYKAGGGTGGRKSQGLISDAIEETKQVYRAMAPENFPGVGPATEGQKMKKELFGTPVDKASREKAGKFFGVGAFLGTFTGGLSVYHYMKNSGLNPEEATPEEVAEIEKEINVSDNSKFTSYEQAFSDAVKAGKKEFTWANPQRPDEPPRLYKVALKTNDEDVELIPTRRENKEHGGSVEFSKSVTKANKEIAEEYAERMTALMAQEMNPEPSKKAQEVMRQKLEAEKIDSLMKEAYERLEKQEGGMAEEPMAMPSEMMEEPTEDVPVDTYPNATPEEIEAAQEPDEVMEEDYIEFVLNEALVPEEQEYLMNTLEDDPQLSQIFDKVVETASEFSGAGEVTGPGDGLSDSIPARLSDGEFVFTKKATDQLGADNLQTMMDDAERAYDGGIMRENRYLGGVIQDNEKELGLGKRDDEIRQLMNMEMSVKANKTPSLR